MNEILFEIWSPFTGNMEVIINGKEYLMEKNNNDWWFYRYKIKENPVDYFYVIDKSKPLPDPRSPFQPQGVHGPSRYIDHSQFNWTDSGFIPGSLSTSVIYELHTGTFTKEGTFIGCIRKLDYLKKLGITHIELMPVCEYAGTRGWGYDGVDLFAPHHSYGGPPGLKQLVNECHKKGISVILDVVYNHLGPEGNYLELFGPYFTDRYKTPWGKAVNLDGPYSHEVRSFFIDNALMWLKDYHIDGLRIDAVHSLHDISALHFLEELADNVERVGYELHKNIILIIESDLNDPRFIRKKEAGGYRINAQWNDDYHHALHSFLTGEKSGYYSDFGLLEHIEKAWRDIYVYNGQYSIFRKKNHGRKLNTLEGSNFVVYSQNHDQTGNRVKGDRLHFLISCEKIKLASALILTSPFIPMIFQGEEWCNSSPFLYFTDFQDMDLGKNVKEGRQKEFSEFGWDPEDVLDPQKEEAFIRSKLKWEEQATGYHKSILAWYKKLIKLRMEYRSLSTGNCSSIKTRFSEEHKWLYIIRNEISIIYNFLDKRQSIPYNRDNSRILLSSSGNVRWGRQFISLPELSIAIVGQKTLSNYTGRSKWKR